MDTVKVNGVELTRAQVEQALTELNAVPALKNLMRVTGLGHRGVILIGDVQQKYVKQKGCPEGRYTVVDENGGGWSYETVEGLLQSWTVQAW